MTMSLTMLAMIGQRAANLGRRAHPGVFLVVLVISVVVVGLVIWAIMVIVRSRRTKPTTGPSPASALDILALRYARGEIETADYQERKQSLTA